MSGAIVIVKPIPFHYSSFPGWSECQMERAIRGHFLAQDPNNSASSTTTAYLDFHIDEDGVSGGYGNCHQKLGSELHVLKSADECYKCVRIRTLAPNVLSLFVTIGGEKCLTNANGAIGQCPSESLIRYNDPSVTEFLLFSKFSLLRVARFVD